VLRCVPRTREDTGASALELAFLAPVLIPLIFMIIQGILWWYGRTVALEAAREGVSQMRLVQSADASDEQARAEVTTTVEGFVENIGHGALIDPGVEATYPGAGTADAEGQKVVVRVRGNVISLVPGLTLSVDQTASGQIERFEGANAG
jgi:hypothetical protein